MQNLSFKELKEENLRKEKEAEAEEVEGVKTPKPEEAEIEPIAEVEEAEEAESDDNDEESEGEPKLESWQQTDDESTSDDQSGFVPDGKIAAVRRKLKSKLKDSKDENETLKARIAELENAPPQAPRSNELPPRPKREDFDFDEEAFDAAVDEWNDKKLDIRLNARDTKKNQASSQAALAAEIETGVNDHYERADKLVEKGLVTEDAYRAADHRVRSAIDAIFEGQGDAITDRLISTLNKTGEGSEKVLYQLGVNKSSLDKLSVLMRSDPTGLEASMYLGTLQSKVSKPQKQKSNAPRPGAKVEGESVKPGPAGTLQKKYNKMTDVQERVSFKRKAKREGIDTSQW